MSHLLRESTTRALAPAAGLGATGQGTTVLYDAELHRLGELLWRKKVQIALCALVTLLAGFIATTAQTTLYQSTALLRVAPTGVNATPYTDPFEAMSGKGNYDTYLRTQEELLKSDTVRRRVADSLTQSADASLATEIPYLSDRFSVVRIEGSQLFRLAYTAESPDSAATIVNLFASQLIEELAGRKAVARQALLESIRGELADLEQRLQTSEEDLATYAADNKFMKLDASDSGLDPMESRLVEVERHLVEAEADQITARSDLDNLLANQARARGTAFETPAILKFEERLSTLKGELGTLQQTFGERWPAIAAKKQELEFIERQLAEERNAARDNALDDARLAYEIAASRQTMLEEVVQKQHEAIGNHQRAAIEYNLLRREVATNEELYAGLLERLKQGTLMNELDTSDIELVEAGAPVEKTHSPNLPINLALSLSMGLGLGFGMVVLRGFWDRSITDLSQIERDLNLPALGALPRSQLPALTASVPRRLLAARNGSKGPILLTAPKAAVEKSSDDKTTVLDLDEDLLLKEAVMGICTSILLAQADQPLRVIAVTSGLPGEGKTTVSRLLGHTLAASGAKTLLVDADFRRSSLSAAFEHNRTSGLSLFLSGNSAEPGIRQTTTPNLDLAPAGPKPPNAVTLLNSEMMAKFLERARSDYRFVVVDTPPLIGLSDTRVLCAKVDGIVLTVRAGKTKSDTVARAWSLIEGGGGRGLGVVLNGADPKNSEFASSYGYYYA